MHGAIPISKLQLRTIIESALRELQPHLIITNETSSNFTIEGSFQLSGPNGPFDHYVLRLVVSKKFPSIEPLVFETAERIPRIPDRHINSNGSCCLTVWEEWLAIAPDFSFRGFLDGPLKEFFLNQWWFEKDGRWRFGERPHGAPGIVQAYACVLEIPARTRSVIYYLRLLSQDWPKGHWICPCGSGLKLRDCHKDALSKLHKRLQPILAKRMLRRLWASLPRPERLNSTPQFPP